MATLGVMKRLEEEVTCPLCLYIYTEPKKLPCEHVYCKQCLQDLAFRGKQGIISCPECRTDTPVPPNFDITQFVTPHRVNRLIEMYWQNLEPEAAATAAKTITCPVHKSQALALYCETCESLVCRDCALLSCAKNNHQHGYIEDMVKKYQTDLHTKLQPVKKLQRQMKTALELNSKAETELQDMKDKKIQQTETAFNSLAQILEQERQYFIESIEKSFQAQISLNRGRRNEITNVLAQLASTIQSTLSYIGNEPPTTFLKNVTRKGQAIKHVEDKAGNVSADPAPLPDTEVKILGSGKFKQICQVSNFVYTKDDPLKSHFDRSVDLHQVCVPIHETSTLTLYVEPGKVGNFTMAANLYCCYDQSSETANIEKISPEQYSLSFVPHARGRHELHVTYNDTHIFGCPIPVYVTIEPHKLKETSKRKINNTGGIKCHGGKIYVSNGGSKVNHPDTGLKILATATKHVEKVIRVPGLNEVLVTDTHIYGTDVRENRVVKMDWTGSVVRCVGREGEGLGEFRHPNGIRQSRDKKIYVCDTDNHRIQTFTEDLDQLGVITNDFNEPTDLDFDDVGNLYIADKKNHQIQVLTPEGQHIRNIGRYGAGQGELNCPVSTAVHKDLLYATDVYNHRISVFRTTGEFVAVLGQDIVEPECIAIDEDGFIHITSNRELVTTF